MINNYIDVPIKFAELPLGLVDPRFGTRTFAVPTRTIGSEVARTINPDFVPLKEEKLTAYEVGYTGTFGGKTTLDRIRKGGDPISSTPVLRQRLASASRHHRHPLPGWARCRPPCRHPARGIHFRRLSCTCPGPVGTGV